MLVTELNEYSFLPFAVLLVIFWIFTWVALPETKGKQVGETSNLIQVNNNIYSQVAPSYGYFENVIFSAAI